MHLNWHLCGALLLYGQLAVSDLAITENDIDTLKQAGKDITKPMIDFYHANETEGIPGKLTDTWYIAGSMFMTMIQYWSASGDTTYNSLVSHDLMFQSGEDYNYFSANYSQWLGNDDQMFWGQAAITAAETGFAEVSGKPSWTSLARAVFEMQAERWDPNTCNGGLHWQCWPIQAGYNIKNSISNGGLFFLSSRLARFTKNDTYSDWAEKIWDWSAQSPLINNSTYYITDSTSTDNDCKDAGTQQWSYNYGVYLGGSAYMYNYTNDQKWLDRVNGILKPTLTTFFPTSHGGNIMSEEYCEPNMSCDRNQLCFKGYLSMWLALTALLVPSTYDEILPKLQGSVMAVSKQCSGESENLCGERWYQPTWDGMKGLEVQMAALGIVTANMMMLSGGGGPQTIDTNPDGGESAIDTGDDSSTNKQSKITTGDKAGAWILTVVMILAIGGGMGWLVKS